MSLEWTTAGESHGPALIAVLTGMPAGVAFDESLLSRDLERRRVRIGAGPRMDIERGTARILAGVMAGRTTGAPVAVRIDNADHANWAGREIPALTAPRPGHADLAAALKYGFDDLRPALERASARETAARVAAGAVCRAFLDAFGIAVCGYVAAIGDVRAGIDPSDGWAERAARARGIPCQTPDPDAGRRMAEAVARARAAGETLGGVVEVAATGVPAGLGSNAAAGRRLDARLAAAAMSVPAVKGVEIGDGFAAAALPGSRAHDPILPGPGGRIDRPSNRCGGIEGGISTGRPVWFRAAMKPVPTLPRGLPTVDLATGAPCPARYERSDVCPVPRAVVVLEAAAALVIADALIEKLGGDSLDEMLPRFRALPAPALASFCISGKPKRFW